ncbi:MAG: sigma-54-dependent Fis family transcriptional regulator [Opitutaceae bacterium]|nr:sigma-54-dependent Fis family transcriptional regulator [Cytophagales bacterium]
MYNSRILIIDDEDKIRNLLAQILTLEGYELFTAGSIKSGIKLLEREKINVMLCDVKLPDGNGVDAVQKLKNVCPYAEIILLTAYGNIPDGVKAIKLGAFDYITKGDDNDKIIPLVSKAAEKSRLQYKIHSLEEQIFNKYSFSNILGSSKALIQAKELAKKIVLNDTTVLLTGETGTGKEVFAQAIHYEGKRSSKNFIAVNCSTFTKDLLESKLFGHKAGSFTGATKDQKGLFEDAHEGTIFLDEIGEMDVELQARLLRVLETGSILKVGETKETKVDVRIIAATNRSLENECDEGRFRADLYYRLSVFQIKLPSLAERKEDIQELSGYFTGLFAQKTNKKIIGMEPDFVEILKGHHWKGNIRELKNIIERAVILTDGETLRKSDLPYDFSFGNVENIFTLAGMEKEHIKKILSYSKGNKTKAAELLDIGLTTLYAKLKEYNI